MIEDVNVVVDNEEWESLMSKLKSKDDAIREMLAGFIESLETLVESGFKAGNRHDNMVEFLSEVKKIQEHIDGVYDSAQTSINTLTTETESKDHF